MCVCFSVRVDTCLAYAVAARYKQRGVEAKTVVHMRELDNALAQLTAAAPVDIMPGTNDPSNLTVPQQVKSGDGNTECQMVPVCMCSSLLHGFMCAQTIFISLIANIHTHHDSPCIDACFHGLRRPRYFMA